MKHIKLFEDFTNESAYEDTDPDAPRQDAYKTKDDEDDEEREFRREFNANSNRKKKTQDE